MWLLQIINRLKPDMSGRLQFLKCLFNHNQQAKMINKYKNVKLKLLKSNAAIWNNKSN
jgi:hypothetical protein